MNKVKRLICVLLIFSLVGSTTSLAAAAGNKTVKANEELQQPKVEKITRQEYEEYSNYDLVLTSNQKNVRSNNEVKYYYIESILKDQIILESENLGNTYYEIYQFSNIDKILPNFESINEIALMKIEDANYYSIDYNTLSNERVILEYFSNGIENKTIYNKSNGEFISVNNQYTKTSYSSNYGKEISLQLSEEKLQEINKFIDNGDIESLKLIEGIDVQESDGNLIINLTPDNNANSVINSIMPLASKTNSFPVTNSFPLLNKRIDSTRFVVSSVLQYWNKADTTVYAKVYSTRNNYVQVKFSYRSFAINTTLAAISVLMGFDPTLVSKILYFAGVVTGIVGTAESIKEAVDIANDAEYTYTHDKTGYVFDKTLYNQDVRIFGNVSKGTFDGGILPSGQWAWIASPPAAAGEVDDNYLLTKTIANYEASINTGGGFCSMYYPD